MNASSAIHVKACDEGARLRARYKASLKKLHSRTWPKVIRKPLEKAVLAAQNECRHHLTKCGKCTAAARQRLETIAQQNGQVPIEQGLPQERLQKYAQMLGPDRMTRMLRILEAANR